MGKTKRPFYFLLNSLIKRSSLAFNIILVFCQIKITITEKDHFLIVCSPLYRSQHTKWNFNISTITFPHMLNKHYFDSQFNKKKLRITYHLWLNWLKINKKASLNLMTLIWDSGLLYIYQYIQSSKQDRLFHYSIANLFYIQRNTKHP